MPRIVKPLTNNQCKSAKPRDSIYKLTDGGGLYLAVLPSGKKTWRLNFQNAETGKNNTITLGEYPHFGLYEAREWRDEMRKKIALGVNIKEVSQDIGERYRFENRLVEWYERWKSDGGKTGEGKSEKYAKQVLSALEINILPDFKGRDVRKITTPEIVSSLRKIEERGALEYLKRVKISLNLMFEYLIADGTVSTNPVSVIGKQVFKKAKKNHFKALHFSELPLLIERLESGDISKRSSLLIYWQFLSLTRPAEAAGARFNEIDFDKGVWEIPIERMKTRQHVVPLSRALLVILQEIREINKNGIYLFEGAGFLKPVSAELQRLRLNDLGLNTTAHGLRSLARTYLREKHKIPHDVGELLLSHSVGDSTEQAYNRFELIAERLEFLNKLGDDVLALREQFKK